MKNHLLHFLFVFFFHISYLTQPYFELHFNYTCTWNYMRQISFISSYRSYLYFFPFFHWCLSHEIINVLTGTGVKKPEELCTTPAPAKAGPTYSKGSTDACCWREGDNPKIAFFLFLRFYFCRTTGINRLSYKRTLPLMSFNEKKKQNIFALYLKWGQRSPFFVLIVLKIVGTSKWIYWK